MKADTKAPTTRSALRAMTKDDVGTMLAHGKMVAICPITGIRFAYEVQGFGPLKATLELQAPFASISGAKKIVLHHSLSQFSNEVLAGLILAIAGPSGYKQIELQTMEAVEANAALCLASHATLCLVLRTLASINSGIAERAPRIALPEAISSMNHVLKEWVKLLSNYIPTTALEQVAAAAAEQGITILDKKERNQLALAKAAQKLGKHEVEWTRSSTLADAEEEFKESKKQAKLYWITILNEAEASVSAGLAKTMKMLLTGRNLNHCNAALRAKLVSAITVLPHAKAQPLAKIIKECYNPYDPLIKDADILLEDAGIESAIEQPKKRLSLAELLAAKKAARAQAQAPASDSKDSSKQDSSNGLEDF